MATQKAIILHNDMGECTHWTVDYLIELIASNKDASLMALRRVYLNQTASEAREGSANTTNGIGFNKSDAPLLTKIAKELEATGQVSEYGLEFLHREMPKYSKQVFNYMCSRYPDKIVILKY